MILRQLKKVILYALLLVVICGMILTGYQLLHMRKIDFESTILRIQCQQFKKDSCPIVESAAVGYDELPLSLKSKLNKILEEDSRCASFDINTYAYPTGISVIGKGYRVYVLKKVTVFAGIGLGQYSASPQEAHLLYFDELQKFTKENGKRQESMRRQCLDTGSIKKVYNLPVWPSLARYGPRFGIL